MLVDAIRVYQVADPNGGRMLKAEAAGRDASGERRMYGGTAMLDGAVSDDEAERNLRQSMRTAMANTPPEWGAVTWEPIHAR
jgi:hypothetical protein